jgi:dTDP-4-dehydrorhamnose reductase
MASLAKPPKTAVIGASGFLGRHLLERYRAFHPGSIGTSRRNADEASLSQLDLTSSDTRSNFLKDLVNSRHEHVVIAAAVTSVPKCEADPSATRAVNVEGTLELARAAHRHGLFTVWFSSDYVFDGRTGGYADDAAPNPLNEYGWQKAEVEQRLLEVCGGQCVILRLAKVYGTSRGDGTLLDQMAQQFALGRQVRAARDMRFSPVLVDDVINAVVALQTCHVTGVVNVAGPGACTRLELAALLAGHLKVDRGLVVPITLDELGENLVRPKDTSLRCLRIPSTVVDTFQSLLQSVEQVARQYLAVGEMAHI